MKCQVRRNRFNAALVAIIVAMLALLAPHPASAKSIDLGCGSISDDNVKNWIKECGGGNVDCILGKGAEKTGGKKDCTDVEDSDLKSAVGKCSATLLPKFINASKEMDSDANKSPSIPDVGAVRSAVFK